MCMYMCACAYAYVDECVYMCGGCVASGHLYECVQINVERERLNI